MRPSLDLSCAGVRHTEDRTDVGSPLGEEGRRTMNDGRLRRRRFLQSAVALGLGASLADWTHLRTITPAPAAANKFRPRPVLFRPHTHPAPHSISAPSPPS